MMIAMPTRRPAPIRLRPPLGMRGMNTVVGLLLRLPALPVIGGQTPLAGLVRVGARGGRGVARLAWLAPACRLRRRRGDDAHHAANLRRLRHYIRRHRG
jgi:hypothetical protein